MRQTEAQAQAAMRAGERRWLDPDDDGPTASCPTCDGETSNFENHGCDEDCRRGCRGQRPAPCDDCERECSCCRERLAGAEPDARGWCPACVAEEVAEEAEAGEAPTETSHDKDAE